MLLSDDDQLVFLDFGLVTRLPPDIMEGFAEPGPWPPGPRGRDRGGDPLKGSGP